MIQEETQGKMTLLLIRNWDGFQAAMRSIMKQADRRGS